MRTFLRSAAPFTLALLVAAGAGCSRQSKIAAHLDQANRHYAAGQYELAEIEYKNVLQLEALNPAAIGRLGLIYFEEGRTALAIPYLTKGSELRPDDLALRGKLALVGILTGKPADARAQAEFILSHNRQDPDAPVVLAESVTKPAEVASMRARLKGLLPAGGESGPVALALGTLDLREGNAKAAEENFRRATVLDPKLAGAHSALGLIEISRKDTAAADTELARAASLSPPRSAKRIQYAQFKIETGDLAGGLGLLEAMIRQTPDYLPAQVALAQADFDQQKYDSSAALVAKILAADSANPDALVLGGRLKLAAGDAAGAVTQLESAQKLYPNSSRIGYQLGVAYLGAGQTEKSVATLTQAVSQDSTNADAAIFLAGIAIRTGDPSRAIVTLKQLLQRRPDLAQAWLLLANAYQAQRDFNAALAVYAQVEKLFPGNPQTSWLTGMALAQEGRNSEARAALTHALALSADYLPAQEQLVDLDITEKKFPEALARAQAIVAKNPRSAGPHLLLAQVRLAQSDTAGAETELQKAMELQPDSPTAYLLLAKLYLDSHQEEKALAKLGAIVAKNPKETGAQMMIGTIEDQRKHYDDARKAYEKLLATDPRFSPAINNLAYLYSEQFNDLDKAFTMAQRARELLPHEPHVADTLGWVLYKRHQYPWALSLLQESAAALPASAEVQYHLGMADYMMGDETQARTVLQRAVALEPSFAGVDQARESLAVLAIDPKAPPAAAQATLEKAVAARPDDPVALGRLAALYERSGSEAKAIASYQKALQSSPNNATVTLALARLYAAHQDVPQAFELAKSAHGLAPNDPEVTHTLATLAYRTGDYRWSQSLMQEAVRAQPDNPDVLFDFAQASYGMGQVAAAQDAMRRALQAGPGFARAGEARRFLELTALADDPAQAAGAAAKIDAALKADPGDLAALMASAAVAGSKADAAGARKGYEAVLARDPDFAPAQERLAALLLAAPAPDNAKALELALKAREALPGDPAVARTLGIARYRQGDYARAATLLQESAARRGNDAELMYYLGLARGQSKDRAGSRQALQKALDLGLKGEPAADARRQLAQ